MATDKVSGKEKITNNISDYTDHIPGTGKRRAPVSLYMLPEVWWAVKKYAYRNEIKVTDVVNEAVCTILKWMKRAELEEVALERMEKTREELKEAEMLLKAVLRERKLEKLKRTREKVSKMKQKYPGILTKEQIEKRRYREEKKEAERLLMERELGMGVGDNVSGTEKC